MCCGLADGFVVACIYRVVRECDTVLKIITGLQAYLRPHFPKEHHLISMCWGSNGLGFDGFHEKVLAKLNPAPRQVGYQPVDISGFKQFLTEGYSRVVRVPQSGLDSSQKRSIHSNPVLLCMRLKARSTTTRLRMLQVGTFGCAMSGKLGHCSNMFQALSCHEATPVFQFGPGRNKYEIEIGATRCFIVVDAVA